MNMEFANREYLLLLLLIIPYILWYVMLRKKSEPTIRMADTHVFRYAPRSWRVMLMPLQMVLRIVAFTLLVIALARPQTSDSMKNETVEGIDIMMAMDVSTSMLAEDLQDLGRGIQNRLEAAKNVAAEFIVGRPNDNIGLTIFAGEAFTQCPMTIDHAALLSQLENVRTDIAARGLIEDGTAIGMGLANAVSRLKDSQAKSRVVILLTDGVNNRGEIDPAMATEIAKTYGIRVYTIGVGANGTAPYPVQTPWGIELQNIPVEIDETLLKSIAEGTGGRYFRATDNTKLAEIYGEIGQMEKTRTTVDSFPVYKDLFKNYALAALLCLLLEVLIGACLRRLP